jgi:hypothetical protein
MHRNNSAINYTVIPCFSDFCNNWDARPLLLSPPEVQQQTTAPPLIRCFFCDNWDGCEEASASVEVGCELGCTVSEGAHQNHGLQLCT